MRVVGDSCQPFSSPTAASPRLWALSSRAPSPLSCLWQPINFLLWELGVYNNSLDYRLDILCRGFFTGNPRLMRCLTLWINMFSIPPPPPPISAELMLAGQMEKKGKGCCCRVEQSVAPFPYPHTYPKGQQGSEFTYPGRGGRQQQEQKSPGESGKFSSRLGCCCLWGVGCFIASPWPLGPPWGEVLGLGIGIRVKEGVRVCLKLGLRLRLDLDLGTGRGLGLEIGLGCGQDS